jgi:uncharacterized membrane protein
MRLFSTAKRSTGTDLPSLAIIAGVTTAVTLMLMQIEGPTSLAGGAYQTPPWAVSLHVGTVLTAVVLGLFLLARRKGGAVHRRLGIIWMGMMVTTAVASFWIRGDSGAFSGIHLFSVGTLVAVPMAIWRARVRDIRAHRQIMISLYVGLIVAGVFALSPNRVGGQFLWQLLFLPEQTSAGRGLVASPSSRIFQPIAEIQISPEELL